MTVTTASASDATNVMVSTRPVISARYCGTHSRSARLPRMGRHLLSGWLVPPTLEAHLDVKSSPVPGPGPGGP